MVEEDYPRKRWIILAIVWGAFFAISMSWYVMPTLRADLMEIYGLTDRQFRLALTVPFGIAGILAIPGGMLADRLGIRYAATMGMSVSGFGFIMRSQVGGFYSIFMAMVLVGVGLGLTIPNLPKLVSVWFPPREAGLATGIYNTGLMGGVSTGLVLAPFLPGWSTGNVLLGLVVLTLVAIFFVVVRDTPPGRELPPTKLIEGLQRASGSKNAWLASLGVFAALCGMVALQSEFPNALDQVYGISSETGGQIASMITYGGIVGSLTVPAIANKLDRRKGVLLMVSLGFGLIQFPVWLSGNTTVLFIGTALAGYLAGGAIPILMEVPTWLPRVKSDPVGSQHVGGASGMLTSSMNIGGFVGLSLIIGPVIHSQGYTIGFGLAMAIFSLQGILGLFFTLPKILE